MSDCPECVRHRNANLVRSVLEGYGDKDEYVNEAINHRDFDRVPWLIAQKAIAELDAAQLRSIEARNPGIDMDEVRAIRSSRRPSSPSVEDT